MRRRGGWKIPEEDLPGLWREYSVNHIPMNVLASRYGAGSYGLSLRFQSFHPKEEMREARSAVQSVLSAGRTGKRGNYQKKPEPTVKEKVEAALPVHGSSFIRPLSKEELMGSGRTRSTRVTHGETRNP